MKSNKKNGEDDLPKQRKVTQGPIREKAKTMDKLVKAVGQVLRKKGYTGLSGVAIAREAGVNTKLIYLYFGSVNELIEIYIKQKDFWTDEANAQIQELLSTDTLRGKDDFSLLLKNQFEAILRSKELQNALLWEISENTPLLFKISSERDMLGEELFKRIEPTFEGTNIDLRPIAALLIGGVYYTALHSQNNGSSFCGLNLNDGSDRDRLEASMRFILDLCYREAEKQKS